MKRAVIIALMASNLFADMDIATEVMRNVIPQSGIPGAIESLLGKPEKSLNKRAQEQFELAMYVENTYRPRTKLACHKTGWVTGYCRATYSKEYELVFTREMCRLELKWWNIGYYDDWNKMGCDRFLEELLK